MDPARIKLIEQAKRVTLLNEYFRERARTEWHIHKYFEQKELERTTMLPHAELSNRWADFKAAFKTWFAFKTAKLRGRARLANVTPCGALYDEWETR